MSTVVRIDHTTSSINHCCTYLLRRIATLTSTRVVHSSDCQTLKATRVGISDSITTTDLKRGRKGERGGVTSQKLIEFKLDSSHSHLSLSSPFAKLIANFTYLSPLAFRVLTWPSVCHMNVGRCLHQLTETGICFIITPTDCILQTLLTCGVCPI